MHTEDVIKEKIRVTPNHKTSNSNPQELDCQSQCVDNINY